MDSIRKPHSKRLLILNLDAQGEDEVPEGGERQARPADLFLVPILLPKLKITTQSPEKKGRGGGKNTVFWYTSYSPNSKFQRSPKKTRHFGIDRSTYLLSGEAFSSSTAGKQAIQACEGQGHLASVAVCF